MKNELLPIHLIQTFVVFVESTNITEAAGRLDISQPAVSVHLKKFEERLPHPVFIKKGKRKQLSEYGRAIYKELSQRYHHLQDSINVVNEAFLERKQELRVLGPSELLPLLIQKSRNADLIHFTAQQIDEKHLSTTQSSLFNPEAEIFISSFLPNNSLYSFQLIYEDQWALCAHSQLLTDSHDLISLDWQKERAFIMNQSETELEPTFQKFTLGGKVYRSQSWEETLMWVQSKMGYALLPTRFIEGNDKITRYPLTSVPLPTKKFYAVGQIHHLQRLQFKK